MKRPGSEILTLFPGNGQDYLEPGTYYTAVVSEGVGPTATALGTGASNGALMSNTPLSPIDVGTLSENPVTAPLNLQGGKVAVYQMTVPAGAKMVEAWITNRVGNPGVSISRGLRAPKPFPGTVDQLHDAYGWVGGQTTAPNHPVLVSIIEPVADVYTVVVRANGTSTGYPFGHRNVEFQDHDGNADASRMHS